VRHAVLHGRAGLGHLRRAGGSAACEKEGADNAPRCGGFQRLRAPRSRLCARARGAPARAGRAGTRSGPGTGTPGSRR
jgi:hypothetical protein